MAIIGAPDLNNYRQRLVAIQQGLISGSQSDAYQLGGNTEFPQWFNTIAVTGTQRIDTTTLLWSIQARFFLARGKRNNSQFDSLVSQSDADVVAVLNYFYGTLTPFLYGASYTDNQAGYQRQPLSITGDSPAYYLVEESRVQLLGSSYTVTFHHRVSYPDV